MDRICFPVDIAFSRDEFLFHLSQAGSITRVAEVSGTIAGFVLARIDDGKLARILTLDVAPAARRRHIGSILMEDVHRILEKRKIGACVLEVGTGNIPARGLYEKMEYRYIETLHGYYRAGGKQQGGGRNHQTEHSCTGESKDAYRMIRLITDGEDSLYGF